jgi:hypothetical protein
LSLKASNQITGICTAGSTAVNLNVSGSELPAQVKTAGTLAGNGGECLLRR